MNNSQTDNITILSRRTSMRESPYNNIQLFMMNIKHLISGCRNDFNNYVNSHDIDDVRKIEKSKVILKKLETIQTKVNKYLSMLLNRQIPTSPPRILHYLYQYFVENEIWQNRPDFVRRQIRQVNDSLRQIRNLSTRIRTFINRSLRQIKQQQQRQQQTPGLSLKSLSRLFNKSSMRSLNR